MYLGINANNHDASICLADNVGIKFAAHAERYSRVKNDKHLNKNIVGDCLYYGQPKQIIWSERPLLSLSRKLFSGEPLEYISPKKYLKKYKLEHLPIKTVSHHGSHAALGYYTSNYSDATVLVIDAIGEWDTISIWNASGKKLKCVWNQTYPDSIGLFYSAITQAIGLKPNEEEYILMGMAAYGEPRYKDELIELLFRDWKPPFFTTRYNMHCGIKWLLSNKEYRDVDLAASAQAIYEEYLLGLVKYAKDITDSENLILSGGCALNCVANTLVRDSNIFYNLYVPPNTGDGGLSLGAVLYKTRNHINLDHAYWGHDLRADVNLREIVSRLINGEIIGIANGRAEFGPRALGNRSLIADPRGATIKDRVNEIKHREKFRPFAPVVLKELAHNYFDITRNNHYFMQYAVDCKDVGNFPAICHVDGTSRVQTVDYDNPSIIRKILEIFYRETGCPMLLNTSLNIKGEPLVNDYRDAVNFSLKHNIPVF